MLPMSNALPIQQMETVSEAANQGSPVVVFCLFCNRAKKVDAYLIAKHIGEIPFGVLVGKLLCKRCDESISVVLPWYAPTPREWLKNHRVPTPSKIEQDIVIHLHDRDFRYSLDTWTKDGNHKQTIAVAENNFIGRGAFDAAVKHHPEEHITLTHGAHVLADSDRSGIKPVD